MLEKTIVKKIRDYLKTVPECYAWKTHGGQYSQAGIPDIICCIKGRFVAFEVKTPDGKPTVLQEQTIRKLRAAGGIAEIVRSVDDVKTMLIEANLI